MDLVPQWAGGTHQCSATVSGLTHLGGQMSFEVALDKIVYEEDKYTFKEKTQCAALVQQLTKAPETSLWRPGLKVKDAKAGDIKPGTAIATFDEKGRYPTTDPPGRHTALYVKHDDTGITVIDQWVGKPTASQRVIKYAGEAVNGWQNNGDYFYVVELQPLFSFKGCMRLL